MNIFFFKMKSEQPAKKENKKGRKKKEISKKAEKLEDFSKFSENIFPKKIEKEMDKEEFFVPTEHEAKEVMEKGEVLQESYLKENPSKELNTTLSNAAALIDEIDRKAAVPKVKDPKFKDLPLTVNEYVRPDKKNIDKNRIHSLMSLLTNDDIIELFGQKHLPIYLQMKKAYEARVKELQKTNPEIKLSAAKFRKLLLDLPSVVKAFMANGKLVEKTWTRMIEKVKKHNEKVEKNKEALIAKRQASSLVSKPKRKFLGALLSKISPEQYREALRDFNDADKGKRLHKYANLTPTKMIKELERRSYADFIDPETGKEASNAPVAKLLADPDAYKADNISQGVKKKMKDIEVRLADKTEEQKLQDDEYKKFVKPHKDYKLNESAIVTEVRAMIAKGMKPEEIKAKLEE